MKPKQLNWTNDEGTTWYAETHFGSYLCFDGTAILRFRDDERWIGSCETKSIESLKQMCQKDYDCRAYALLKSAQACFEEELK